MEYETHPSILASIQKFEASDGMGEKVFFAHFVFSNSLSLIFSGSFYFGVDQKNETRKKPQYRTIAEAVIVYSIVARGAFSGPPGMPEGHPDR